MTEDRTIGGGVMVHPKAPISFRDAMGTVVVVRAIEGGTATVGVTETIDKCCFYYHFNFGCLMIILNYNCLYNFMVIISQCFLIHCSIPL